MSEIYSEVFGKRINDEITNLPQIKKEDINPEASIASFICYMYNENVSNIIISERSGFNIEQVEEIIFHAHKLKMFHNLVNQFLIK